MRNATTYGVAPRLRTDLVVNDFVGSAVATGRIQMKTAGHAHRPLIHVEDVARAYACAMIAPDDVVRNETFNVVRTGENYRIIEVADEVQEILPACVRDPAPLHFDRRDYRLDGAKLERAFPRLKMRWTLQLGIRQLYSAMVNAGMTPGEWRSDRYRRVLRLQGLLERGEVDARLRHRSPAVA